MSDTPSRAQDVVADWSTLPGGVVDGGEIIILAIKPSTWRPVFDSAAWLVTSCLLAGVLAGLQKPIPGLSLAVTTQLILLVGIARLAVAFVCWAPTWYILTNRRVLNVQGIRYPRITSCALVEIRNTYLNRSSAEKLTGLGTITFAFDSPHEMPRVWQSIAQPDLIHDKVRRAIENAIDQQNV